MIQNSNRFKSFLSLLVVLGLSSIQSFSTQAFASLPDDQHADVACGPHRTPLGGGSGHSTGGLFSDRIFVELADGEEYLLVGTIHVMDGAAYLGVNFDCHPWLGTAKRKAFPFYVLEGDVSDWTKWLGKNVVLRVEAHGKTTQVNGIHAYGISLESLREPSLKFKF